MATVNAQSVEEFDDRTVYRFPAGRYEQVPVAFENTQTPGLKTLVNTQTNISYNVPSSGIVYKFYKIELVFKNAVVFSDAGLPGAPLVTTKMAWIKYAATSLNYDGKSLQSEFYEEKTVNFLTSPQLRSINIQDISVEPVFDVFFGSLPYNTAGSVSYLVSLLQFIVTGFKKNINGIH